MTKQQPAPMGMRIEYEYPPMRAIHATWFEDEPQFTDDEMKAAFLEKHPRAKIRKIERNVPHAIAISRGWHNQEFDQ